MYSTCGFAVFLSSCITSRSVSLRKKQRGTLGNANIKSFLKGSSFSTSKCTKCQDWEWVGKVIRQKEKADEDN